MQGLPDHALRFAGGKEHVTPTLWLGLLQDRFVGLDDPDALRVAGTTHASLDVPLLPRGEFLWG